MMILGFNTSKFGKKQNSPILALIMHIANFPNLNGADMHFVQMGHKKIGRRISLLITLWPVGAISEKLSFILKHIPRHRRRDYMDYGPAVCNPFMK